MIARPSTRGPWGTFRIILEHISLCLCTDHTASLNHGRYMVVSLFLLILLWWRNLEAGTCHQDIIALTHLWLLKWCISLIWRFWSLGLWNVPHWELTQCARNAACLLFGVSKRLSYIFPESSIPGKKILSHFKATSARGTLSLPVLLSLSSSTYWTGYIPVIQNNHPQPPKMSYWIDYPRVIQNNHFQT